MDKIVIERSIWIDAPRERVWLAVSKPEQITQWFAPGTNFIIKDKIISIEMGETFVDVAEIVIFDPPHRLATIGLPERAITTTYTLEEENGGTRFIVTETGLETLPEDQRNERYIQDSHGWEAALKNLEAFIDGKDLPRPEGF